ncbi:hypothetical protein SAMN05443575_0475 [Jatrophihabitans endophyticus]|uniref:Permease n=1 Tax=Jatrophihabitans endophyticus TaxID=1206085 RepID=A0A1M5D7D1_9ACTN|nr:permease [Jatrophihabitans endophyticus]SHF62787.1 hypothetical protein SAMN05443575_0475 [Jatrophihabitans endophyticus]
MASPEPTAAAADRADPARRLTSTDVFCAVLLLAVLARLTLPRVWSEPGVQAWTTVFAALCIQAAPYLVLGVTVSTLIAVLVPPSFFARVLPARPALAVPVAGLAGVALPGCECGSVPVAASLMRRGVAAAPAVAFLLAAPAINPVVLVATSVAFPGRPEMVLGRFLASLLTALVVGWLWLRWGRTPPLPARYAAPAGSGRLERARATAAHDLAQSLGLLTVGAAAAATVNVALPSSWLDGVAGHAVAGVVALALLAVVVAVCSEADAFVASSFVRFSPTAQLAFMTVGPAVDVKLIAMQVGTFGARVAVRLAPLAFAVAVGSAVLVGWWVT